ncbi:MAG: type I glutamate--ammonia ligase [Clostridiales bacterium]|nr:type I glutamate--ammonia ligase [Clostridiales bacterium]
MKTWNEILELIEEEDVEFVRLQFTDIFGTLKNVAVTADQFGRLREKRYIFDGSCVYGEAREGEEDMFLCPDPDTFVILPWRPQQGKVARLLCDVRRTDGTFLETSPREILKRVLRQAEEKGYVFHVDPECEFFLFHTDENGIPTTVTHEQAGYMDMGPLDLGENARRDIVMTLEEMGFQIEASHHETAPAQHEIDFKYAKPLAAADQIVTFKSAVRSIARRFGLHATFMPKPKSGVAGSGMHINFSLYKDGVNLFADEEAADGLSQEAGWFTGGIMAHVKAMCAVTNPLVNSYKRLMSGFEAPGTISWTAKNQNALVRIPFMRGKDTRIELRFPDPSANPYLTLALCIAAGLDGIENRMEPGVRLEEGAGSPEPMPKTLQEAVSYMEQDEFVKDILGQEFVEVYTEVKKAEWNGYISEISEWEIENYLYRT